LGLNILPPKQDIAELQKRLQEARTKKNKKQIKIINEEMIYQQRMIQSMTFLESNEQKINAFYKQFVEYMKASMMMIKGNPPVLERAVKYIKVAGYDLEKMKHLFKILKQIEKYLLKMDKKLIRDLKREKAR
jgi:hypothetical protein